MSFQIYKTRIEAATGNIVAVRARAVGASDWFWVATGFVVQMINDGVVFNTLREVSKDNWRAGARVEVYNEKFLRTYANATEKDNLESLPSEKI